MWTMGVAKAGSQVTFIPLETWTGTTKSVVLGQSLIICREADEFEAVYYEHGVLFEQLGWAHLLMSLAITRGIQLVAVINTVFQMKPCQEKGSICTERRRKTVCT